MKKKSSLVKIISGIPRNNVETNNEDVNNLVKLVFKLFTFANETELKSELNLRKSKWIREKNKGLYISVQYFKLVTFKKIVKM